MKKHIIILLIISFPVLLFAQNKDSSAVTPKKVLRFGIDLSANYNTIKRDEYFPYTPYYLFYTANKNDSVNFYKNAFGFMYKVMPYLGFEYRTKKAGIHSIGFNYIATKKAALIYGNGRGHSSFKLNDINIVYAAKFLVFKNRIKYQITPFVGCNISVNSRKINENEDFSFDDYYASIDTTSFTQSMTAFSLQPFIGLYKVYKRIYFETGISFNLLTYVQSNYEFKSKKLQLYPYQAPVFVDNNVSFNKTVTPDEIIKQGYFLQNIFIKIGYAF